MTLRERQWSVVIETLRENGESEKNVINSVKDECRNVDKIFMLFWVKTNFKLLWVKKKKKNTHLIKAFHRTVNCFKWLFNTKNCISFKTNLEL